MKLSNYTYLFGQFGNQIIKNRSIIEQRLSSSSGRVKNKETVLTSLVGDKVVVDVSNNTNIEAPFGGAQTGKGKILNIEYESGSFADQIVEAFAGPHDFLSSWNYIDKKTETYLNSDSFLINAASGLLLIPSVPFAIAPVLNNNPNFIDSYKNFNKENKNILNKAILEHKENR